jgi:hypothetical protein
MRAESALDARLLARPFGLKRRLAKTKAAERALAAALAAAMPRRHGSVAGDFTQLSQYDNVNKILNRNDSSTIGVWQSQRMPIL